MNRRKSYHERQREQAAMEKLALAGLLMFFALVLARSYGII